MTTKVQPTVTERKKLARYVSLVIYAGTTIPVILYYFANREKDLYSEDTRQYTTNTTDVCYKKEIVVTFPELLTMIVSLLGTALGVLVSRALLAIDERHHVNSRYGGSQCRMFMACFNGISCSTLVIVFFLAGLTACVIIYSSRGYWDDQTRLFLSFLSGIGTGPLVMHLLHLDTESTVYISTILEKEQVHPAYILAWSYYHTHLKYHIDKFRGVIENNGQNGVRLFQNKLLLLMPINFCAGDIDKLKTYDESIIKVDDTSNSYSPFSVWKLEINSGDKRCYAVHYIKEPLATLIQMRDGPVKFVTRNNWVEQAELIYHTLSDILQRYVITENACLIPIKLENDDKPWNLKERALTSCIMDEIEPQLNILVDDKIDVRIDRKLGAVDERQVFNL